MNNIKIGIVDDDKTHVTDIKRVFSRYAKVEDTSLSFVFESFYKDENSDYETLLHDILEAIKNETVDCLIIDYQLIFVHEANTGADVINVINSCNNVMILSISSTSTFLMRFIT